MTQISCPRCHKACEWSQENPYRPFCSKRCKMSDLDGWLTQEYAIPSHQDDEQESSEDDY